MKKESLYWKIAIINGVYRIVNGCIVDRKAVVNDAPLFLSYYDALGWLKTNGLELVVIKQEEVI